MVLIFDYRFKIDHSMDDYVGNVDGIAMDGDDIKDDIQGVGVEQNQSGDQFESKEEIKAQEKTKEQADESKITVKGQSKILQSLHQILKPFVLRRVKTEGTLL